MLIYLRYSHPCVLILITKMSTYRTTTLDYHQPGFTERLFYKVYHNDSDIPQLDDSRLYNLYPKAYWPQTLF